jgi:hypothetical protein
MIFSKVLNLWSIAYGIIAAILIVQSSIRKLTPKDIIQLSGTYWGRNSFQIDNLCDLKADTFTGLAFAILSGIIEIIIIVSEENLNFCFIHNHQQAYNLILFSALILLPMSFQFYKKHEKKKISSLLIKHDFEENLKHLKSQLEKTDLTQINSLKNNAPKINIRRIYKEITKKNISITDAANDKPKDILPKIIKDYSLPTVFSEQELECIENIIKDESL